MLRDVFYYGNKPNVHPREQFAENLADARLKATTRDFWIINEFSDYRNFDWDFDFEFLPDEDVWAEDHINVWPSQHQKDSGTWLCPKEYSDIIIYRNDVDPVIRKNEKTDQWIEIDLINHDKFDFSWHPDPTDPPYIYKWPCKFFPAEFKHVLEYRVPGATQEKYMNMIAELVPEYDRWVEHQAIDKDRFDLSWRPNPLDPPFIYVWGNKYIDGMLKPTLEYHAPDAVDKKYMPGHVPILPEWDKWIEVQTVDKNKFDFTWRPDPREPAYIYTWGNKHINAEERPTVEYHSEGATERKYMDELVSVQPEWDRWKIVQKIDMDAFDFTWRPDPKEPPYIYVWGNKWIDAQLKPTLEYHVPGATEIKYMSELLTVLPEWDKWVEVQEVDKDNFDFTWRPDPREPAYIYTWGNKWIDAELRPTLEYHCEGAIDPKYMSNDVPVMPETARWKVLQNILPDSFDFTWRPDPREPPHTYVFGNELYDAIKMPTVIYSMPDGPETKYIHDITAKLVGDKSLYEHLEDAELEDYSWLPDPDSPPYIYAWGNQWNKPEDKISVQYVVPGATQYKYMEQRAVRKPNMSCWEIPDQLALSSFDFSWEPNPKDPPYVYQFGTQWQKTGGPKYVLADATETKYVDVIRAKRLPNTTNFYTIIDRNITDFDYSWQPDETEEPYIYVFGNNWYSAEKQPTIEYRTPGATKRKYINDTVAFLSNDMTNWEVPSNVDRTKFDFSWYPDPNSPPYIYEFATLWNNRGGPVYNVPGATEHKYIEDIKAGLLPDKTHWEIPTGVDTSSFDFSWVPHPDAPAYIYQFGTKTDNTDGPRYITPNNNSEIVYLERIESSVVVVGQYPIETTLDELVAQHPNEIFWATRKNIDYSSFDFDWRPGTVEVAWELDYVHVFGSTESELTQTYFISAKHYAEGKISLKFVEELKLDEGTLAKIFAKPDMFFVDRSNPESAARFEALKAKYGTRIQKTRYLNSWVDTINRCINRSTTELLWVLNSELDYSDFDFEYYPNPWQMKMVQVFGTQWSHWGTTFMVNRESFAEDTKYIKIIEHLSNLNFVKSIRAKATKCVHDIVVVDHGNKETSEIVSTLQKKAPDRTVITTKYSNSYLNTLKEIIKRLPEKKEHFIWVCSSVCDYTNFDFTYIIDPFSRDNLHVFPSGKQKFGDTFFIDVNNAREVIGELEQLENFTKVNYNGAVNAARLPEPIIVISDDTHTSSVDKITDFPYATFITSDNSDIDKVDIEPMNLWSAETKNIYVTSTGATRIVVPKEIKDHVTKELYEYPYIKRAPKLALSKPLDIVFLSNGETGAEEHYDHLLNITKNLPNRVVRVDGVNGRAAAYHAAAEASETPWMFTVFAKLKVSPKFDWNWQPDRMQSPKHYIFHAKNPVNGLIYGHQAMIAYNKKLTLANDGKGLDFTLDDEHEIVPLISGTAQYNTDEFSTWRTAFREVIKLKADESDVSKERLDAWLNNAEGDFAEYSIKGALDADEYYNEVSGEFVKLKLSYEWAWLRERFIQL
jgi:hypothetical protein